LFILNQLISPYILFFERTVIEKMATPHSSEDDQTIVGGKPAQHQRNYASYWSFLQQPRANSDQLSNDPWSELANNFNGQRSSSLDTTNQQQQSPLTSSRLGLSELSTHSYYDADVKSPTGSMPTATTVVEAASPHYELEDVEADTKANDGAVDKKSDDKEEKKKKTEENFGGFDIATAGSNVDPIDSDDRPPIETCLKKHINCCPPLDYSYDDILPPEERVLHLVWVPPGFDKNTFLHLFDGDSREEREAVKNELEKLGL